MSRPYRALLSPFRRLSKVAPEERYQQYTVPAWGTLLPLVQWFENRRQSV